MNNDKIFLDGGFDENSYEAKIQRSKNSTPCDTPANPVQAECKDLAPLVEKLTIKLHGTEEGLAIEFSTPVKMVIFNKVEALQFGETIINNALKL